MAELSRLSVAYQDFGSEVGTVGVAVAPVTDANFVAMGTLINLFRVALDAITDGRPYRQVLSIPQQFTYSGNTAGTPQAQREAKWLVQYRDTSEWLDAPTNTIPNYGWNNLYTIEIPTASMALITFNTDHVYGAGINVPEPAIVSFVSAFNGLVKSPSGGNAQVINIWFVGRDL